jgi:hypothetical protein
MFDPEELLFLALQDCKRFIRFFNGRTAFENIPRSSELDGSCWSTEALFCEISHDILTPIFSEALETQNHQGSLRILGHTHTGCYAVNLQGQLQRDAITLAEGCIISMEAAS